MQRKLGSFPNNSLDLELLIYPQALVNEIKIRTLSSEASVHFSTGPFLAKLGNAKDVIGIEESNQHKSPSSREKSSKSNNGRIAAKSR